MRKIFSILFILVFLFNIIGYFPVFIVRQNQVRNELDQMLNQQIAKENIVKLSFDSDELRALKWLKKNEFSYKGEMYDIILTEQSEDGKLVFYCFLDKKEKHLLVQLEKHVQRHIAAEGRTSDTERNFTKSLIKDFYPVEYEFSISFSFTELGFNTIFPDYHSLFPSKHTPPPKFV